MLSSEFLFQEMVMACYFVKVNFYGNYLLGVLICSVWFLSVPILLLLLFIFRDICPVLKDCNALRTVTDLFTDHLQKHFPKIDAIVGKCYDSCSIFISFSVMCQFAVLENLQFQKISILSHGRDSNFLGVEWGVASVRPKNVMKCMQLNWNRKIVIGIDQLY